MLLKRFFDIDNLLKDHGRFLLSNMNLRRNVVWDVSKWGDVSELRFLIVKTISKQHGQERNDQKSF